MEKVNIFLTNLRIFSLVISSLFSWIFFEQFSIFLPTFHVFVLSASSSLGCFWPCVFSLQPAVYLAQQPKAHTCRHPVCISRALYHPSAPQQREQDHIYWRGSISWTSKRHLLDQWGKTKRCRSSTNRGLSGWIPGSSCPCVGEIRQEETFFLFVW